MKSDLGALHRDVKTDFNQAAHRVAHGASVGAEAVANGASTAGHAALRAAPTVGRAAVKGAIVGHRVANAMGYLQNLEDIELESLALR